MPRASCTEQLAGKAGKIRGDNMNLNFNTYPVILSGTQAICHNDALDWARGYCFGEEEPEELTIHYADHIDTVNGIDVWYDVGADYYFFTDARK